LGTETQAAMRYVDEAAQHVPPANVRGHQVTRRRPLAPDGRLKPESAMRPRLVVVPDVSPKDAVEVSSAEDEGPVQALGSDRPHPSFAGGVGVRGPDRGEDDAHALGPEHLVEGAGEFGVPVVDQERGGASLILEGNGEVPGLLGRPSRVRVRCHPSQADLPPPDLDPHKHVQRLQGGGLYGEKVAGHDPGSLLAEELAPGGASPGSWP
jgi:hypothetical protein